MRLLIADDEHLARLTLRSMIEDIYPEYSIEEVSNGEDLITKSLSFRPHIAFVDIQMPKFTGLQAIAQLKEKLPLTQWIILTGYAHFDFAKEALCLGVSDYLVKPLRPSKLKDAMVIALSQYTNEFNRRAALYEQEVRDILHGSKNNINSVNIFKLILIHLEKLDENQIGLLIIKTKQELAKLYDNQCDYALLKVSDNELLLVIGLKQVKKVNFQIDKIYDILKNNNNLLFWIFVSPIFEGNQELINSVKNLRKFGYNWLSEECFQIIETRENVKAVPTKIIESFKKIKSTNSHIENKKNIEEIRKSLDLLILKDKELANSIYVNLQYLLSDNLSKCDIDVSKCEFSNLLAATPSLTPQIADVVDYINHHYSEDIGVKQIAPLVGLSPNYLSSKFKAEMNMRFLDYLTKKRIERASFLVKNSNLFIHEIAKEVGFKDVKHFSRLFKEYNGCLPSEYK